MCLASRPSGRPRIYLLLSLTATLQGQFPHPHFIGEGTLSSEYLAPVPEPGHSPRLSGSQACSGAGPGVWLLRRGSAFSAVGDTRAPFVPIKGSRHAGHGPWLSPGAFLTSARWGLYGGLRAQTATGILLRDIRTAGSHGVLRVLTQPGRARLPGHTQAVRTGTHKGNQPIC